MNNRCIYLQSDNTIRDEKLRTMKERNCDLLRYQFLVSAS